MAALNALVLSWSSANTLNFVEPRQKSNVLYCEKQTGKPIPKNKLNFKQPTFISI